MTLKPKSKAKSPKRKAKVALTPLKQAKVMGLPPEMEAAVLRSHMGSFIQAAFAELNPGVKLMWAPYLELIAAHLEQVAHGEIKRLIITMPPRYLKSICVSVALPAFVLGHYPYQEVMCVSYGQDLAKKFSEATLKVMRSRFYRRTFGAVLEAKRHALNFLSTVDGGGRRATSIDGTATGTGANLLIFDDPQKPNETLSEAVRRATNDAFENTFLSRINDHGEARIVVVMQRLHEDDFVAHVQANGEDWTVLNLPAIAEQDEAIPYCCALGDGVFQRREGEALHPERAPLAQLELLRKSFGEATWATQYQQRPTPAGGGMVKVEWFRRYAETDLPEKFDRVAQSWDTANKIAEWNDYSVCTTWGVKGRNIYLLHVYRARLEFPDLKRAVIRQAQLHEASVVFVEDHASGTQIIQDLRRENFGKVHGVKHSTDKQIRMVNQTPLIENGFVFIPEAAPWLEAYLGELEVFPNGKHDDQVDSTSQALEEIHSFKNGQGVYDYYREEAEKQRAFKEALFRVRPAIGINRHYDREGHEHCLQADGCFHITMEQAGSILNLPDWKLEGPL
jgi:predicted phage terminase large subunit-like protein